jgi:hypothetical protein
MIKQRVEVPIYGYTIWLVKLSFDDYKKEVRPTTASIGLKSKRIDLDEETCDEIDENIKDGDYNGAITCHRGKQRKAVVFFYPIDNEEKAVEIYDHEKRHLEDFILNFLDVDDTEAAAYLAGYLGKVFWKFKNK